MNKQKGQALIEFALVLPFFLLLIFGLIYTGMLFHDYSTLSNIARTAARERAITDENNVSNETIINRYYNVDTNGEKKFTYALVTDLYKLADTPMTISTGTDDDDIIVTINMQKKDDWSVLMEMVLPENYSVVYHMRKDYK